MFGHLGRTYTCSHLGPPQVVMLLVPPAEDIFMTWLNPGTFVPVTFGVWGSGGIHANQELG